MISKKSFTMLLKDDLKKRSWLMLVSVLFFYLFFPGIVLDNVQGMISIYGEQGVESRFLNALTYSGNNYYAMGCCFCWLHSVHLPAFLISIPDRNWTFITVCR